MPYKKSNSVLVLKKDIIAESLHEIFSILFRYLVSKGKINEQGDLVLPASYVQEWKVRASTSFSRLSEEHRQAPLLHAERVLRPLSASILNMIDNARTEKDV